VVTVLLLVGAVCFMVGWVWLVVAGFVESFPWGVGTFFIPLIGLVFSVLNWPEYKVPTILMVVGFVLLMIGKALG
jgi:hypothetical protein